METPRVKQLFTTDIADNCSVIIRFKVPLNITGAAIGVYIEIANDACFTRNRQRRLVRVGKSQMEVETTFRVDNKAQTIYARGIASTLVSPVAVHYYGVLPPAPSGVVYAGGILSWKKVDCVPRVLRYHVRLGPCHRAHETDTCSLATGNITSATVSAVNINGEGGLTYFHKLSEVVV